jgi:hypothetical protein
LQRDEDALQEAQRDQRKDDSQRNPKDEMYPERRIEGNLHPKRRADDDEADNEDDEDGRPVAGIGEGIVEPAIPAVPAQRQEAGEQLALAAARTAPLQAGLDRVHRRPKSLVFFHQPLPNDRHAPSP